MMAGGNNDVNNVLNDDDDEDGDDDFNMDDDYEDKFEFDDDSFKFNFRSPVPSSSSTATKTANPFAARSFIDGNVVGGAGDTMPHATGSSAAITGMNDAFLLSDEEFDRNYCKPPTAASSSSFAYYAANNRSTPAVKNSNTKPPMPQYNAGGDHRPSTYRVHSHATSSIVHAQDNVSPADFSMRHSLNFFSKKRRTRRCTSANSSLTRLMLCYYPPTLFVEQLQQPSATNVDDDEHVLRWRRLPLAGVRSGMSRDEILHQLHQHKKNRLILQQIPKEILNSACSALAQQYTEDVQAASLRWFSAWATKCDSYSDINSLDVSKDGRLFLVAFDSRQIHVMSTAPAGAAPASSESEHQIFDEHKADVAKAVFNQPWCNEVVSICADGYLRVFDVETGITKNSIQAHQREVTALSVSHHRPSGSAYIATGGMDNRLHIFDSRSNFAVFKTDQHHTLPIRAVEWNECGKMLVSSGDDCLALLWDIRKNDQPVGVLGGHTGAVSNACIDCTSRFVITSSEDRTVKLWNIASSNPANQQCIFTSRCHSHDITDIKFNTDGSAFASASRDGTACIYTTMCAVFDRGALPAKSASSTEMFSAMLLSNIQPNHLLHKLAGSGANSGEIWSIAFNSAGTQLAAAHNDGKVRVYNVKQGCLQQEMLGFKAKATHVKYSYDGELLVAAGKDRNIKGWTKKYE